MQLRRRTIAVRDRDAAAAAPLPTEVRLFAAGENPTTKGVDVFDEEAQRLVMGAYQAQNVDLMVDLNHDAIDPDAQRTRADASDAMAWFKLEVRNGELWATEIRWTPDGEARLRSKKQRYFSPAFRRDEETGRVLELVNVALVSMPATHGATPLVAASRVANLRVSNRKLQQRNMTPEQSKQALDIIAGGDEKGAFELVRSLVEGALSGGETDVEIPADAEATVTNAETPPPAPGEDPEKDAMAELAALGRQVLAETGATDAGSALTVVKDLQARSKQTNADAARLESLERRSLVTDLVVLGAETPATAWAKAEDGSIPAGEKRTPVKRLCDEPIVELRSRVAELKKSKPAVRGVRPAGAGGVGREAELDEDERARAAQIQDPAKRAKFVELRLARKAV